jgi:hypothetical protein
MAAKAPASVDDFILHASDTEGEQGNEGRKNRDHPTTVWRRRKNLYCFSAIWNLEQAQASGKPLPSAIVHALVMTA